MTIVRDVIALLEKDAVIQTKGEPDGRPYLEGDTMNNPTITITPAEIRYTPRSPREFWEFGEAFIPKGERMLRTHHDGEKGAFTEWLLLRVGHWNLTTYLSNTSNLQTPWPVDLNRRDQTVRCRRAVRRDGTPRGPWFYSIDNLSYLFDPKETA